MIDGLVNYGKLANVDCEACPQHRKIFVNSPTNVYVFGGERYLMLRCPSPACNRVAMYKEIALEIH